MEEGIDKISLLDERKISLLASPSSSKNPTLIKPCGVQTKIVLILDSSDSMSATDIQTVKNTANALATSLVPANKMGVIDFDTTVISSLSPTTGLASITTAINSIGHTSSTEYTNREAALKAADSMVGSDDLIIVITDGNPTRSDGSLSDLDDAIVAANTIKAG